MFDEELPPPPEPPADKHPFRALRWLYLLDVTTIVVVGALSWWNGWPYGRALLIAGGVMLEVRPRMGHLESQDWPWFMAVVEGRR